MTHKELVLSSLNAVLGFEKSEANKKTRGDVHPNLCHEIRRVSPVILDIPSQQQHELVSP